MMKSRDGKLNSLRMSARPEQALRAQDDHQPHSYINGRIRGLRPPDGSEILRETDQYAGGNCAEYRAQSGDYDDYEGDLQHVAAHAAVHAENRRGERASEAGEVCAEAEGPHENTIDVGAEHRN